VVTTVGKSINFEFEVFARIEKMRLPEQSVSQVVNTLLKKQFEAIDKAGK
jgi:predicted CopG family antitoxin